MKQPEIRTIAFDDEEYPELLREINGAPKNIFVRGRLKKENDFAFGIVGTRLATNYGKEVAYEISFKLAQAGLTIVSGLALGIDTAAHQGALAAGGRTIAVLACGLDDKTIFPQQNLKLAHQIIENGALVSEYSPGTPATKEKFPLRNRIISGISRGVLIVEAPLRSGALITAHHALEQNREVFAIPGNISSKMSFGTNLLIKQGAALVTRAEDILEELNLKFNLDAGPKKEFKTDNPVEQKIFDILQETGEPKHIDEVVRSSGLKVQNVNVALTAMEMKGIVKNLGNGQYVLDRKYLTDLQDEET
ncbi:MAG: DNA-processing protein DprA [Candidatus Paceibacteria bacterium]